MKKGSEKYKTSEKNSNIRTLDDYNSDTNDEVTYSQMESLLAASFNKNIDLVKDNSKLRAENKVVKEYLNKSVGKYTELKNENDILKVKLIKYEPKSSSNENKKIVKECQTNFSDDQEWLKNIQQEHFEANEKAFRDYYASNLSFLD